MNEYIYLAPIAIAFFLAFNMGASGMSPSFSVAHGANLIRKDYIPGLFGVFVIAGALLAGHKVMATIGGAILPAERMSLFMVSIVLLASALSLLFANILKVPQSTSQSTVFALAGCAWSLGSLQTGKLFLEIVPMWFVLPIAAFLVTLGAGFIGQRIRKTLIPNSFSEVHKHPAWRLVTLACSCYVAFSIGSNNVANAAAPIASLFRNDIGLDEGVSVLMLSLICILLVAPWFGIGASMLGGRVLATTAKDMLSIGPMGAALVSVVTATLLLLASSLRGIPSSLVQMNVFAIMALGCLRKGRGDGLKKTVMAKMFATWLAAPAMAFLLACAMTALARRAGWL